MPLLESAPAVLTWLDAVEINLDDKDHSLFFPLERDRKTPKEPIVLASRQFLLSKVKKYARQVGIQVDRLGRRGRVHP